MEILKSFFLVIFHLLRIAVESIRILADVLFGDSSEEEKPDSGGPYYNRNTGEFDTVKTPWGVYDEDLEDR